MKDEKAGKQFLFPPESIKKHALWVEQYYHENPALAAAYLSELLKVNMLENSDDPEAVEVRAAIKRISERSPVSHAESENNSGLLKNAEVEKALQEASKEIFFRKQIEEFYLPKQLVDAIIENGEIPDKSEESFIGVGFLDIADYTYLSKFLTPLENQIVLNGLYAAFSWVLKRHGGYLNKIEGDSLMFHFGGNIDPYVKNLSEKEARVHITKELFYTCVEMQRVAFQFNEANDSFLYGNKSKEIKDQITKAFEIIGTMRNSDLAQSINAFFQIRIRIGANIGEVTMGNFGPEGSKQWDVIGVPVIKAKRMETTAPIGGFRISEEMFDVIKATGIVDDYYNRFTREASALFSAFKEITMEELFKFSQVSLKEKKSATFVTYSIQVNPGLPEAIMRQVNLLLNRGEAGADRIVDLLQYYRGNKFVINKIEEAFKDRNIHIRKNDLYRFMFPNKYDEMAASVDGDVQLGQELFDEYTLFDIFQMLGTLQDTIKTEFNMEQKPELSFSDYKKYMSTLKEWVVKKNSVKEKRVYQRNYFFNYIFPMMFISIRTSIIEYQNKDAELTEV